MGSTFDFGGGKVRAGLAGVAGVAGGPTEALAEFLPISMPSCSVWSTMCDAPVPTVPLALASCSLLSILSPKSDWISPSRTLASRWKPGFFGQVQMDVAAAVVDLHIAERAHGNFDSAIFVL